MGLSITKAYVEMLGGKIWVTSEEGSGTTFNFSLPNLEPVGNNNSYSNEIKSYSAEKEQVKKLKILIAEDDKISKFVLKEFTLNLSKEILEVNTGIEAVEICYQNPDIDLVLMDIQMPEMNGYEATRQIRKFNKDVVIIAQTAYALTSDREKAMAAGCNDYISKPFTQAYLIEIIKKYFTQN